MSWRNRVAWAKEARKSQADERRFRINLFVSKAYEDEQGDWYVDGVASGTRKDRQGDRMTAECIADMASQINSGTIPYCKTHWDSDWDSEIGYLRSGSVDPMDQLRVTVWLDKRDCEAQKLWRKLRGDPNSGIEPRKLGMSIGGRLVRGSWKSENGESVYVIEKVQLVHVVPTSMPAYPDALISSFFAKDARHAQDWLGAIYKACPKQPAPSGTVGHAEGGTGGPMKQKAGACADGCACCSGCDCCEGGCCQGACEKCHEEKCDPKKTGAAGEAKRLGKGDQNPPPNDQGSSQSQDGGDQNQDQDKEPKNDGGMWMKATDITEQHECWCRMPQQQQPSGNGGGEPQKSQEGENVITKDKFDALEGKVDKLASTVGELAETMKSVARQKPADENKSGETAKVEGQAPPTDEKKEIAKGQGHPKGLRSADTEEHKHRMEGAPANAIEELKKSEAYQKADHYERVRMLDETIAK